LVGLGRVLGSLREAAHLRTLPEPRYVALGQAVTATALLLATLGIVIWAGVRYDVFPCFQGRLLFPAFFSLLLLVAAGFDGVVLRRPAALRWMNGALVASYVVFGAYFIVEVASAVMAS
jgi:hypothetical protein